MNNDLHRFIISELKRISEEFDGWLCCDDGTIVKFNNISYIKIKHKVRDNVRLHITVNDKVLVKNIKVANVSESKVLLLFNNIPEQDNFLEQLVKSDGLNILTGMVNDDSPRLDYNLRGRLVDQVICCGFEPEDTLINSLKELTCRSPLPEDIKIVSKL